MNRERAQSFGEEVAYNLSHGFGLLLAVVSLPILLHFVAQRGGAVSVVGASLFGTTMILLYGVSTLYHALLPRVRQCGGDNKLLAFNL